MPACLDSTPTSIRDLVELDRYPIASTDSNKYKKLVADCREQLSRTGACVLPGFVTQEAVLALAKEAEGLAPQAYRTEVTGNAYLTEIDQS